MLTSRDRIFDTKQLGHVYAEMGKECFKLCRCVSKCIVHHLKMYLHYYFGGGGGGYKLPLEFVQPCQIPMTKYSKVICISK